MAVLETRKLSKHFGGLAAISELDLEVQQGEILGVIGPNGAGKTTFFNVITGYLRPTEGKVIFQGEEIAGLSPNRIAQRGLVRTFQQTELFSRLPVIANMMMGRYMGWKTALWQALLNARSARHEKAQSYQRSMDALNFVGLGETPLMLAGNLPHGHQRLLGLAMALAAEPKLLLLDEPVTGMNQEEANFTLGLIKRIRESGITVVVVEHDMRAVMGISDRILVLNYGRKIAEGSPAQIRGNQEVIDAYLGVEESAA